MRQDQSRVACSVWACDSYTIVDQLWRTYNSLRDSIITWEISSDTQPCIVFDTTTDVEYHVMSQLPITTVYPTVFCFVFNDFDWFDTVVECDSATFILWVLRHAATYQHLSTGWVNDVNCTSIRAHHQIIADIWCTIQLMYVWRSCAYVLQVLEYNMLWAIANRRHSCLCTV
jgi:hypothetical protein